MSEPGPDLLQRLPLFRRLQPEDRGQLANAGRLQTYERGEQVFEEGDEPQSFVTIVEGRVKVFKRLASGRDLILHLSGPGDPIGAVAVFEGRPYPASAHALERTECLVVPRQPLLALLEKSPGLVRGLLSGLTLRLLELTDRLTELTGAQVDSRFARLFLKLADQFGRRGPDGLYVPLALSRQELADLTGTTIETCIRIMSRWGKDGILITERHGFAIVNRPALEAIVDR